MTADWGARRELGLRVAVVTPEAAPLQVLGDEGSEEVRQLLDAHQIELHLNTVADASFEGGLWIPIEGLVDADLVVALPVLVGPDVPGLKGDALGFVPVDEYCRVRDAATSVYAVGDMTNQPIKQGGLAAQQADVAAACIAAAAGAAVRPVPYEPVLRAMLFTGQTPRFLRSPAIVGHEGPAGDGSAVPWWPPHKIVGHHLAPYLATHTELLEPLDRP